MDRHIYIITAVAISTRTYMCYSEHGFSFKAICFANNLTPSNERRYPPFLGSDFCVLESSWPEITGFLQQQNTGVSTTILRSYEDTLNNSNTIPNTSYAIIIDYCRSIFFHTASKNIPTLTTPNYLRLSCHVTFCFSPIGCFDGSIRVNSSRQKCCVQFNSHWWIGCAWALL